MIFGSVCSGIEAASVAWKPLGWKPAFFSEIEKFPNQVLAHHYPDVPNFGDMTKFKEWPDVSIDLLCGGTPCQSFSIAGLRKGLDDPRGNLMLTYLAIAKRYRPRWLVWENVPGVRSSWSGQEACRDSAGNNIEPRDWQEGDSFEESSDFASFLEGLSACGYQCAWRTFDAQYFGVAQRRERVFVVGYIGDWRPAAAVLFERESLQGHPAPSREKGQRIAPCVTNGPPFSRTGNERVECEAIIPTDGGGVHLPEMRGGGSHGLVSDLRMVQPRAEAFRWQNKDTGIVQDEVSATLRRESATTDERSVPAYVTAHRMVAFGEYEDDGTASSIKARDYKDATDLIAFDSRQDPVSSEEVFGALGSSSPQSQAVSKDMAVRRLTPVECERLQGFPDNYTKISERTADGPRYKALGNSWAVPNVRWIGQRIDTVDKILRGEK